MNLSRPPLILQTFHRLSQWNLPTIGNPIVIANLTLTDFEAWIGKYLKKGYVLHSCNLIPSQDNKMLVVVERNPEKADRLLTI